MRNIKLTIQYDGTRYAGWQRQKNAVSIQERIEEAIGEVTGERPVVTGSGRTDAGVHARAQIANFKTHSAIPADKLLLGLNTKLRAGDIVIAGVADASRSFHAQHDARTKVYRYTIVNSNVIDPFMRRYAAKVFHPLDVRRMRRASRDIKGRHDFKAFQAQDGSARDSVRTVTRIRVAKAADVITIDIEADGFLYNMVRNIVGTLVEIGRGRFPVGHIRELCRTKDRRHCGPTMPAKGLCLMRVHY